MPSQPPRDIRTSRKPSTERARAVAEPTGSIALVWSGISRDNTNCCHSTSGSGCNFRVSVAPASVRKQVSTFSLRPECAEINVGPSQIISALTQVSDIRARIKRLRDIGNESARAATHHYKPLWSQGIAVDEDFSAQYKPIIDARHTVGLREVGFQTRHLRVVRPEEIRHVHRSYSNRESGRPTEINRF